MSYPQVIDNVIDRLIEHNGPDWIPTVVESVSIYQLCGLCEALTAAPVHERKRRAGRQP